MNYMRLAFAWVSAIALTVLIGVTVIRFRVKKYADEKAALRSLIVSWVVFVVLQVIVFVYHKTEIHSYLLANILSMSTIYTLINIFLEWIRIIAFTVSMVHTARFLRRKK